MFNNTEYCVTESEYSDEQDLQSSDDENENTFIRQCGYFLNKVNRLLAASEQQRGCEKSLDVALLVNRQLQENLNKLNEYLLTLLNKIRVRIDDITSEIDKNTNPKPKKRNLFGMRGAYLRGGKFYSRGNMFFRDKRCRSCPNNADYKYRKNKEGEMFPMDFDLTRNYIWSNTDKGIIVRAIKNQILNENRDNENNTSECELRSDFKIADLLKYVPEDFKIDWHDIAAGSLCYRHSATSCEAIWNSFLHPTLNRKEWTKEENRLLWDTAQKFNLQNWAAIAKEVGRRSEYQCFVQYQAHVCKLYPNRWKRWQKSDDQKLISLVEKNTTNGVTDWTVVTTYFKHKPKNDVIARYATRLKPQLNLDPFTPEEDLLLISAVAKYGENFNCIPRTIFPTRTVLQLRTRYLNTLKHRHKTTVWTIEDDQKLLDFVTQNGTSNWLKCSKLLGNHTRTSCRTRYLTITKYLKENPKATIENLPRKRTLRMDSVITTENWIEKSVQLQRNPNIRLKQLTLKEIYKNNALLRKKQNLHNVTANAMSTKVSTINNAPKFKNTWYNLFRYSYDYSYNTKVHTKWPGSTRATHIVARVLKVRIPMAIEKKLLLTAPQALRKSIKLDISKKANIQVKHLTPNYSLGMAFRALCICTAEINNMHFLDLNYKHDAIRIFRKRFEALFYYQAVISRINPIKMGLKQRYLIVEGNKYRSVKNVQLPNNEQTFEVPVKMFKRKSKATIYSSVKKRLRDEESKEEECINKKCKKEVYAIEVKENERDKIALINYEKGSEDAGEASASEEDESEEDESEEGRNEEHENVDYVSADDKYDGDESEEDESEKDESEEGGNEEYENVDYVSEDDGDESEEDETEEDENEEDDSEEYANEEDESEEYEIEDKTED